MATRKKSAAGKAAGKKAKTTRAAAGKKAKSARAAAGRKAKTAGARSKADDAARRARLAALKAQYSAEDAPAETPSAAETDAGSGDRRQRLRSLKEQFAKELPAGVAGQGSARPAAGGARSQAAELSAFMQDMGGRRQKRQHQLQLIKEFFDNPLAFGAEANIIPTSSSAAEIEKRKKEVAYRMDLLKSVLAVLEGEMEMLNRGRPVQRGDAESGSGA